VLPSRPSHAAALPSRHPHPAALPSRPAHAAALHSRSLHFTHTLALITFACVTTFQRFTRLRWVCTCSHVERRGRE
jgi:hypothetical protein